MPKIIYLVYCGYYCEPFIQKAYFDEQEAKDYAKKKNDKWKSKNAWYVEEIEVY